MCFYEGGSHTRQEQRKLNCPLPLLMPLGSNIFCFLHTSWISDKKLKQFNILVVQKVDGRKKGYLC